MHLGPALAVASGGVDFSQPTKSWFQAAFEGPTEAQTRGWESIAKGDHTLILAPTGSGKTLAAFLWALDRIFTTPGGAGCRVLYVSPLKALAYDVARNLRAPLAGITIQAARAGVTLPEVRVGIRSGDTSPQERREMARRPPDILITTPESLYLLLTSSARHILKSVQHVIVDEIHAVAGTKRGVHLALSLERLEDLADQPPQRIGLSATQRPLDELARFLGGHVSGAPRPVSVVDAGVRKAMELKIVVPVDDMGDLARPAGDRLGGPAITTGEPDSQSSPTPAVGSIWPAVYPELLNLIRQHRSTLVFVNSRRLAERLAARLNEMASEDMTWTTSASTFMGQGAPSDLVRAHHGSIAREQRLEIENALKAGTLPALVATSSLELGIDMGSVDLVVQVESPSSVSSGLQRIGRAGHRVGEPSKARIFPKYRHDLLVAAAVVERMHAGAVEHTKVIRNPLDVLAQQIVAEVAAANEPVAVDRIAAMVRRAYSFVELPDDALYGVLDMLSGRYPTDEYADLRPRLNWDRTASTLEARPGTQMLAVTSGGTIPDRGLYGVFTPGGGRVGELDEEMVYESRVGETFLLGATTWRILDITRDRVVVEPAPGMPGKMPFWHGDTPARPYELGVAIGEFTRTLRDRSDEDLVASCGLDERALGNLRRYVDEEREATGGLVASDRQIVVERFRDELGDWRVAILSPFGARVHAPWALGVEAQLERRFGMSCQALWSDDGIMIRFAEAEAPPSLSELLLDPDSLDELVVAATGGSSLFAGRFRENAARSLLLPRRRLGSRTPLWQLRQRAADLLGVATRHGSFPVLLETYRECLQDVFDLPALEGLLKDVRSRRVKIDEVELVDPSPFASGLVMSFIAQFMYEGDAPIAERRAQALTLDRRMLSELLGSDELRDLLDTDVLDDLEDEMQFRRDDRRVTSLEGVADMLRRIGDLSAGELEQRCSSVGLARQAWDGLVDARRAVVVRVGGEQRLISVEDAARYRDGVGAVLAPGLPDVLLEPVPDALIQLVRRWARTHGPFDVGQPAERFGVSPVEMSATLGFLVSSGKVLKGGFRPGGVGGHEFCDAEVLRVARRRCLAALRKEVEPVDAAALAGFLPVWHGAAAFGEKAERGGADRLLEVIGQLEALPLAVSHLEADVLEQRVRGYQGQLLDELVAAGEVMWVGAGSLGASDGRVVLARRDQAEILLPRFGHTGARAADFDGDVHEHIRETLRLRGACFYRDLVVPGLTDRELTVAVWDLAWAGEVTSDSFAALRAATRSQRAARRGRPSSKLLEAGSAASSRRHLGYRPAAPRAAVPAALQGRWSLVDRELGPPQGVPASPAATSAAFVAVSVLMERYGVLTRDAVRSEALPGGFTSIYQVLRSLEEAGRVRRGYFVAGLGAAQFALPGAVDRLRSEVRDASSRQVGEGHRVHLLAATDPANPYGSALPWPVKGPSRAVGAYVVLVDGRGCAYIERGLGGLTALADLDGSWEVAVCRTLAGAVGEGRWPRLVLSRYPEGLEAPLLGAGFVPGPKGMVLYRR